MSGEGGERGREREAKQSVERRLGLGIARGCDARVEMKGVEGGTEG